MASRSAFGLLKLCNKSSYSRLTGISSSSNLLKLDPYNNYCHHHQIRFVSDTTTTKLSVFQDIVRDHSDIASAIKPVQTIFGDAAPVLAAQDLLCQLHDVTGFGWIGTIVLTTVGLRIFIGLPISVIQNKASARLENIAPEAKKLIEDLRVEVSIAKRIYNWDDKKAKRKFKEAHMKHRQELFIENNCHPMRPVSLQFLQIPTWVLFTSSVTNLVYMIPRPTNPDVLADQQYRFMQFFVENTVWAESLITPDPLVLPAIFVLSGLLNIEVNCLRKTVGPPTKLEKVMPWVMRVVIVSLGAFATTFPAAVALFWATSSVCALFVNIFVRLNIIRSIFRIPKTPSSISLLPDFRGILRSLFRFQRSSPKA